MPDDGLPYRTIHNVEIQTIRRMRQIPCGIGGMVHDYVAFYFGYLSPMLFQLKTGRVAGYDEGQDPLIYLVSSAQSIADAAIPFVFSNGHGIAAFTDWYDDLSKLDQVDWGMVYQHYWSDQPNDLDRQRRKQAEFLVHKFCPWSLIQDIVVISKSAKMRVEKIMAGFASQVQKPVTVRPGWYY
jgi:hypothetical protein